MKLTIDPASGIAGDMLTAALIDAGADRSQVEKIMNHAGKLLGQAEIKAESTVLSGLRGTRLLIRYKLDNPGRSTEVIQKNLDDIIVHFSLSEPVAGYARRAFRILCEAEEKAHRAIEAASHETHTHHHVHLHEAQDILVDIAGSALALQLLKIDLRDVVCLTPVFYGGGTITFSHGTFPVPAPATRAVIDTYRIPTTAGPVEQELLTPTGASLLAALAPRFRTRADFSGERTMETTGVGLGTHAWPKSASARPGLIVRLHEA